MIEKSFFCLKIPVDRILSNKNRIFSANDRILFVNDGMLFVNDRILLVNDRELYANDRILLVMIVETRSSTLSFMIVFFGNQSQISERTINLRYDLENV